MILPIIGQECVVTYRGELHMGKVTKAYVNHLEQFRIAVYGAWGYAIDFKPGDVSLVPVRHGNDTVHDEYAARKLFQKQYDAATVARMINAETGIPKAAPAPAVQVAAAVTKRIIRR